MPKEFVFFDKKIEISQSYIRLLITVFMVAVLAKGAVVFHGLANDDYILSSGIDINQDTFSMLFSQGRYFAALIYWGFKILSINITEMYFPFGIIALLLYSAFVVSILRFVGMDNLPASGFIGSIIVAHPYLTEVFTFRIALPCFAVSLFFSILALEILIKNSAVWLNRALALLATLCMLCTYQIFINYFAVVIIFAFLYGEIIYSKNNFPAESSNVYRERASALTIISTASLIAFVVIMKLANFIGLSTASRTQFITFKEIPKRIEEINATLVKIYWSAEPFFSSGLKALVSLLLAVSIVIIFWFIFADKNKKKSITNKSITLFAFLLLIPVSLGVIIATKDWWPVPRTISHTAVIIGLIFLMADNCLSQRLAIQYLKPIFHFAYIAIILGFMLISNQILADQQRLNEWDRLKANRIISRLETLPNFNNIKFVYINGGTFTYPINLKTTQGDVNVSALFFPYINVALLSVTSGYNFGFTAYTDKITIAEAYCTTHKPWPHTESAAIDDDLAIVCLEK